MQKIQTRAGIASRLTNIQQTPSKYPLDPYVSDFLTIWTFIHENAPNYSLDTILEFSEGILESHTLPFYRKFKNQGDLALYKEWLKDFASIVLKWDDKGSFLFPLQLIYYEVCYHKKELLNYFTKRILTKEVRGTKEELYEFLLPVLINFVAPFDDVDLAILKTSQILENNNFSRYKQPLKEVLAKNIGYSKNTLFRRIKTLNLLQLMNSSHFINMGKLGYETTLFIHNNFFPEKFKKYLVLASSFQIGNFSVVHIPYNKSREIVALQDNLDPITSYSLIRRISSWNLSNLTTGDDPWKTSPPLLYGDPNVSLITPTSQLDISLNPSFDTFRKLTPTDVKILDSFIIGSFKNISQLSKTIGVSNQTINRRYNEYTENNLIFKMNQFFHIGLELTIFIYISTEEKIIPWINHFLTFPKVDMMVQEEKKPYIYYGYIKLPNKWIKPFTRKMDIIKRDYELNLYHKIFTPIDTFKWGISLAETYF